MVDAWDHPLLKRLGTIQRKLHNMEKGAQNRITLFGCPLQMQIYTICAKCSKFEKNWHQVGHASTNIYIMHLLTLNKINPEQYVNALH